MNPLKVVAVASGVLVLTLSASGAVLTDVPGREIVVNAALSGIPGQDGAGSGFGKADGQLALLTFEDTRLKSRHSSDSGATFGPEVTISGLGAPAVSGNGLDATLSADGKIYAAWTDIDPAGDLGVRFARSDDMGQSWTPPLTLVGAGDSSIGVTRVHLATGPAGKAAILYRGSEDSDPWVVATADSGLSWTAPRRIDAATPARTSPTWGERIALDAAGRIYAVFNQNGTIYFTRSIDGGLTFAAEQAIGLPAHAMSGRPHLAVANDGSVLLAVWDSADADHVYILRSTNQGQSYGIVLNRILANDDQELRPGLLVDASTSVVLAGWVRSSSAFVAIRSADSGATWGADQLLATTAAREPNGEAWSVSAARTSAGTFVVAWTDVRSDTYAGTLTSVYARSSVDGGVSWGAEQRVDGGTPGTHSSTLQSLAACGADNVFLTYKDGRDDNERSYDVYANRSVASPLAFGADARVDADDGLVPPSVLPTTALAADGASHVYTAFPAVTTGPQTDILVAGSADGGRSFGAPIRVGSTPAGTRVSLLPELRAFSDGKVYLVYMSDNPGAGRQIRFNRSIDFGASWLASDIVLATLVHPAGYFEHYDWPGTVLEALSDGTVYVAWSDGANVFLARSTNAGVSFSSTSDVDQDGRGFNRFPRICASGNRLVVAWQSPNLGVTVQSVWGVVSNDKGATWGTSKQLRAEGPGGGVDLESLACDGSGHAVAVWPDYRSGPPAIFTSRFDGTNWSADAAIAGASNVTLPDVTYAGPSTAVVVAGDQTRTVFTSRSIDDGATFGAFQRVDTVAPDPLAARTLGRVSADGLGNVWASWFESSAGPPQALVVRRSADGGATFGPLYRLDRAQPQGGRESLAVSPPYGSLTAVLPGSGLFGWAAQRESFTYDAIVNAYDVNDFDRDGTAAAADCNDSSPDVRALPTEIGGLVLGKVTGAIRLSWTSQDSLAGTATAYDIATGLLGDLRVSGGFAAATCLVNGLADTPYDDTRSGPAAGTGFYYLVRAENDCGSGNYGQRTGGAARMITACPPF